MRIDIDSCYTAFDNAHNALLKKANYNLYKTITKNEMAMLWLQEYNIKIISNSWRFQYLEFETEEDATLFLLRWA